MCQRDKEGYLIDGMCGGCMALRSARDYIRILEQRIEKLNGCIRDFAAKCERLEEDIVDIRNENEEEY